MRRGPEEEEEDEHEREDTVEGEDETCLHNFCSWLLSHGKFLPLSLFPFTPSPTPTPRFLYDAHYEKKALPFFSVNER